MMYIKSYKSPLGVIYMRSDGNYLTGLWFKGSKDMDKHQGNFIEADLPIFNETNGFEYLSLKYKLHLELIYLCYYHQTHLKLQNLYY